MNTTDTIALAAAIGTGAGVLVGALIGIPSVYFARAAAKAGQDSASSGKDSAAASRDSAEAARRSADEAAALNEIEAERRVEERARWHHELGPTPPGKFVAESRKGTPTDTLVAAITVPRGYRIRAEAIFHDGGSTSAGLGNVLRPNQEAEFHFEQWPPGRKQAVTKEIWIRFWPPLDGDNVEVWTCSCGRPTGEALDGPGHWEWTVPVVYDHYDVRKTVW